MEYKQKGELFELDLLRCLRTDYFHNDCQECLEICPEEAFSVNRKRLTLDSDRCTNCGVCLGVCPTEALSLEFFDPNNYILDQKEEVLLSCKKDIPCLSAFDVHHFATLLLDKKRVACDLGHCEGCHLNPGGRTLASIKERMEQAQRFVHQLGIEKSFEEESFVDDRRGFFKALFRATKDLTRDDLAKISPKIERLPLKQTLLKQSLKKHITEIPNTSVSTDYPFLAMKSIDKSCTNCGDCVQFCPTNALFFAKEGTAIGFVAGRCIDCDICNDICKPGSIRDEERIDLVEWSFDRPQELIEHQLEICEECNTPFPYHGGELICERCKSFVDKFGDIFKLASEN